MLSFDKKSLVPSDQRLVGAITCASISVKGAHKRKALVLFE